MSHERLKQLRLARGLSLDGLVVKMDGLVSKQSLSKYERGLSRPSPTVATKLASALGVKSVDLFEDPSLIVEYIGYRKRNSLAKKEEDRIECLVKETLEARIHLQRIVRGANTPVVQPGKFSISSLEDAENAANRLRMEWSLGTGCISHLIAVLEEHGIHVLQIPADKKFDGISAYASDKNGNLKAAVIVIRTECSDQRQRFNLAHELAHLLLKISPDVDVESAAHRFAGALLLPANSLYDEIGRKRANVSLQEVAIVKQKYGVSIAAILRRLKDLAVISDSQYRHQQIDLSMRGWRTLEPHDTEPEESMWIRQHVTHALSEGLITLDEAHQRFGFASDPSDFVLPMSDRQAFLRLPIQERHTLLKQRAEAAAVNYTISEEELAWQGGEIIE